MKELRHRDSLIATRRNQRGHGILLVFALLGFSPLANASNWERGFEIPVDRGIRSLPFAPLHDEGGTSDKLATLVEQARAILSRDARFVDTFNGLWADGSAEFVTGKTVGDAQSTSVEFTQKYKGLDVVGNRAIVHFDSAGELHDVSGKALDITLDTAPRFSTETALKLLRDRFQQDVVLSDVPVLRVLQDFQGKPHLVYYLLTRTTASHAGQEVFLDAHTGEVVLELDRAYDLSRGKRTVYSADTEKAREHTDSRGYPTDIDLDWYVKAVEDGERFDGVDRSALNAYRNSGKVYDYYRTNFNRRSYDDRDSRIVSVVHMGVKMNNAFWTSEYKVMGYGDGDGEHLTDLTYGLDVAAHELTHGVTSSTANLVYAAEPGALNESYSDFFGRMVDYTEGDWDIGVKIMAPNGNRRALRNMKNPEEFKQPGSNDSPLRKATTGPCNRTNDRCGVHTNSGIPNRAAALITEAIGKEKTERLYYRVLTTRLSAMSGFHEARLETQKACKLMFGARSTECGAVEKAYDAVKM